MTRLVLDASWRPKPAVARSAPTGGANRPQTTFEAELVALLPVLHRCAYKLTRDREQAMDLVQDTCEKALRFRQQFRAGSDMRAWACIIMRHRFFDMVKARKDALAGGRCVPLEELSEQFYDRARAEQICFTKEALQLAVTDLSQEQASAFWPTLVGATREECAAFSRMSRGSAGTRLHRARSFMRRACAV
jgi:RNA polymerase sigma-70 factor (ECF subfamily)